MNGSRKCGIYINMEFYLAIRKYDTMRFEGKWIQLEDIMLSKVSQVQKGKDCMFSLICERQIQKINIYLYVEHACNNRTTLWNLG
jgi:hypothetical protein